jgi:hypothetical protein
LDRIFYAILIISIAFLAFAGGAFVVLAQVGPYNYFNDAYQAMTALYSQKTQYKSPYQTDLWRPVRTEQRGVTIYKRGQTYNGFTLYTSGHAQKAFLIDMQGKVVHEWSLPLSRIWKGSRWDKAKRKLRPPGFITWEYAYMYPNGDLLALIVGMGDTPWGYGVVKMDKNSKVIWKYWDYTHHHLDVANDGKIYVLTNNIRNNVIKGYEHLAPPRIDDSVVVLSPDGKPLKKVSIMDALLRSPYGRMLHAIAWNIKSDILHTNSIEIIDHEAASHLPFAKPGQVLLSLRGIDAVAVLDLDKGTMVWALQGSWHRQHDADMLPNGRILLFDNWGHYEPGGASRVVEFKPNPLDIVWIYHGNQKHPLESGIRSGEERLPNGNTLIIESDGGRLIEVTKKGEIVWEYINPVRAGKDNELIPVILLDVQRVAPEWLDPAFLANIEPSESPAQANVHAGGFRTAASASGRDVLHPH